MNPQRILQIIGRVGTGLGLGLLVAACSGNDGLRQLNTPRTGPDEFRVLPSKPLQGSTICSIPEAASTFRWQSSSVSRLLP